MNIINQTTKIYSGENSIESLNKIKNSKILVISDGFLVKNKMINMVLDNLDNSNTILVFDEVKPDPPLSVVSKAMAKMIKINADYIIGFGGGSAIDTAKGTIYFLKEAGKLKKYLEFIAIPTTSGTGSEVTNVAVVTDEQSSIKHALVSNEILPTIAILDPKTTESLPASIVANTGMDVFTHALEACVAKGANDYSDALAEKSGELVVKYLLKAYTDANDKLAKEKMHMASNLAGNAFNVAGLGVNHSIAHQLGGMYHIAHGLANAILLCEVIDFNSKDLNVKEKYVEYSKKIGLSDKNDCDANAIYKLKLFIKTIMSNMNLPDRISKIDNIDLSKWELEKYIMMANATKDRCLVGNPKNIKDKDIAILESVAHTLINFKER